MCPWNPRERVGSDVCDRPAFPLPRSAEVNRVFFVTFSSFLTRELDRSGHMAFCLLWVQREATSHLL